ncbi:MAG: UDP-N-acetylglucosamine 1-carboxyvinyltransferase [bacterium]
MSKFIIHGQKELKGEIEVNGAKNAATPILAACLLTDQECILENMPKIADVLNMLEILKSIGVKTEWLAEHKLKIKAQNLNLSKMDKTSIAKMRSSVLLLGPLLARNGKQAIIIPGGCEIGVRPIDTHLLALASLGAKITKSRKTYLLETKKLIGQEFVMNEFSVTATENAVMAAVLAQGQTIINCAACEPHVQDLCVFLNKMGAQISGIGSHTLKIQGVKKLSGAKHKIISDYTETGTFICLAGATQSSIIIKNCDPGFLKLELLKFKQANINFEISKDQILVKPAKNLKSVNIHNMPYPGFAADLLQPFAVLMTQAHGISLIHDWMYEDRFKYIADLNKMGARCFLCDPHRVLIQGVTALAGREITSYDLRAGASLIIAALTAKGKSIIYQAEIIDRGYEKIEARLQNLGADIKRVEA